MAGLPQYKTRRLLSSFIYPLPSLSPPPSLSPSLESSSLSTGKPKSICCSCRLTAAAARPLAGSASCPTNWAVSYDPQLASVMVRYIVLADPQRSRHDHWRATQAVRRPTIDQKVLSLTWRPIISIYVFCPFTRGSRSLS